LDSSTTALFGFIVITRNTLLPAGHNSRLTYAKQIWYGGSLPK